MKAYSPAGERQTLYRNNQSMYPTRRTVRALPLDELWTRQGVLPLKRLRNLSAADVRVLLRGSELAFVCAALYEALMWNEALPALKFWQAIEDYVIGPDDLPRVGSTPCFRASEWAADDWPRTILLEATAQSPAV